VGRLAKRLASGQLKLDYAPNGLGYLPALLKELGIPTDSQVPGLFIPAPAFKSSASSPRTPRAILLHTMMSASAMSQNGEALELTSARSSARCDPLQSGPPTAPPPIRCSPAVTTASAVTKAPVTFGRSRTPHQFGCIPPRAPAMSMAMR